MKTWGDELARHVDLRIHPPVTALTDVDAVPPEDRPDGIVVTVTADQSQWQFVLASTAAASSTARVPADNPTNGRWLLVGANLTGTPASGGMLTPTKFAATITAAQFAALAAGVKSTAVAVGAALPTGGRTLLREIELPTPFSGGGATQVTLNLGGNVANDIVAGQSLFTGAPSAMEGSSGVNPRGDHGGQALEATITSDVDLNKLTAGSVTVAVYVVAFS